MKKIFLKLVRIVNKRHQILHKCRIVDSKPMVEHKTFTDNGEFIKSRDFEQIWITKNVKDDYNATDCLNDDEYLDYKLWEDINTELMFKKHLPNARLLRGKNPNIIFHGGCLGCLSQRLNGLERCKGCKFFRWNSRGQNLRIEGEESATMSNYELKKLLNDE